MAETIRKIEQFGGIDQEEITNGGNAWESNPPTT